MAIKVSKLNETETLHNLAIEWGEGETLNLQYNRSQYTPVLEKKLNQMFKDGEPGGSLARMLIVLIKGWDVETDEDLDLDTGEFNEDGTPRMLHIVKGPVPLTEEAMRSLFSLDALGRIIERLADDQRPNQSKSVKPKDF